MLLIGHLAVALNLLSIAILAFGISVALLSLLWPLTCRFINDLSLQARRALLWGWIISPWLIGFATMLLFVPSFREHEFSRWVNAIAHWHHPDVFYLDSWHGLTLWLFAGFSLVLAAKRLRSIQRQRVQLCALQSLSGCEQTQVVDPRIVTLRTDLPTVFTAGLWRPRCYVTTGLMKQVDASQLDIIIRHELAHIVNKDALKKSLFDLLASYFPRRIAMQLRGQHALATEQIADQSVVKAHPALAVANALVKVARLQKTRPNTVATLNYFGVNDVMLRVQQLILPSAMKPFPAMLSCILILMLVLLSAYAVDTLHHLIESLFTH